MRRLDRVFSDDRWSRHRTAVWPNQLDEMRQFYELLGKVIADLEGHK